MSQKMRKEAVDTYHDALMHVSNCFKTQKMCEKVVGTCPFIVHCVPNCQKTQERCEKLGFFKELFILKYCLDKFKYQQIYKETVDTCLLLTKVAWFVTNKLLKDLENAAFFNEKMVFVNEGIDNVTIFSDDMGLENVEQKSCVL